MALASSEAVLRPLTPPPLSSAAAFNRILVAEDDPLYRRALNHFLHGQGYTVHMVNNGAQALEVAVAPDGPRLIVLDWIMPGLYGPEVCRRLRQNSAGRYQYVLLLTSKQTAADVVEGLEAGADDYLKKPFNVHELLARVRVGERTLKLHDGLLAAQEALRFQATHDALTGIWNRRALFELLAAEVERAQRKSTALSLFVIDLDHFKRMNDEFGHLAGDAILHEVAQRLSAAIRPYDVVGRYGGEEFIVAAGELEEERALQFAERLRIAVAATAVPNGRATTNVSVSVGVVTAKAAEGYSLEKLIQTADVALYAAKRKGRNRVETAVL